MLFVPSTEEETKALVKWAEDRIGQPIRGERNAVAVIRDGQIAAVTVYFNYSGGNVEVAFASSNPRWATRSMIATLTGLPFERGCRRITAISRKSNKRVHKLLEGIGFKREGLHKDLFPDEHGVSFGMTKRWFLRSKWNVGR